MMTTPPPPGFGVTVDVTVEFGGRHTSLVGFCTEAAGTAVMMIPGGSLVGVDDDLSPSPTWIKVAFRLAAADTSPATAA